MCVCVLRVDAGAGGTECLMRITLVQREKYRSAGRPSWFLCPSQPGDRRWYSLLLLGSNVITVCLAPPGIVKPCLAWQEQLGPAGVYHHTDEGGRRMNPPSWIK